MDIDISPAYSDIDETQSFLESVWEISSSLITERDMDATLSMVVQRASTILGTESAAIALLEEGCGRICLAQASGPLAAKIKGRKFDCGAWPVGVVLKSGKTEVFTGLHDDPRVGNGIVAALGLQSAAVAPLKLKENVIGVLTVGSRQYERPFSSGDLHLLETLANHAAVAIGNSQLYERVNNALMKLDAERTKLQGILANLADGVIVCDATGVIILANRAAEEIMDVRAEDIIGKSVVSVSPPAYRQRAQTAIRNLLEPVSREAALNEDKIELGRKIVRVGVSPVLAADHYQGFAVTLQDVTSQEETGRAKTEFVSTVAHELKTPLTALKGSIGLILGQAVGEVNPKAQELLTIAGNNCDRLIRLVDEMMDVARIEAGKMSLCKEQISLYECAVDAIKEMQQLAAEKSISLVVKVVGVPPLVLADRDRMEQVITNLLSNAVRFSPANSEVIVSVRRIHGYVRVSVQDFGAGIPRKDLKKVFEKFYQVGGPASRKSGGTGLGLAITKAIVEQHGGKIYVRSLPDHGSSFVFTIPVPEQTA